jgi:hypoxanthine phosphoribosyltransferase
MRLAIQWSEFDVLCDILAEQLKDARVDLIIGIARGGLPLSVALSHRLRCRPLGTLLANKTASEAAFDLCTQPFKVSELQAPDVEPETILLVDDVVGVGDLFAQADERVAQRFGSRVRFLHAALFADPDFIAQGKYAALIETLSYARAIDNRRIWVDFPWERPET